MSEPTDEEKEKAEEWRECLDFREVKHFHILESLAVSAGRKAERAWHRKYLERTLKMSKHVPGSAMLKAFLESTLEHLAKEGES